MGAIVILLVLGICVFLIWFFEAILQDCLMDDRSESIYVDLRQERRMRERSVDLCLDRKMREESAARRMRSDSALREKILADRSQAS